MANWGESGISHCLTHTSRGLLLSHLLASTAAFAHDAGGRVDHKLEKQQEEAPCKDCISRPPLTVKDWFDPKT